MTTFFYLSWFSHPDRIFDGFMNTISPTIKYTFTYSIQTISFLDVQVYLSERNTHFVGSCIAITSYHEEYQKSPHLQLQYLAISTDTTYRNKHSSHHHSHLNIDKSFIATIHKNWNTVVDNATLSAIWPLSAYSKSTSVYNHLSTPHKHMAHYNTIACTASHINLPTPKQTGKHTHNATLFFLLFPNNYTQLIVVMLIT